MAEQQDSWDALLRRHGPAALLFARQLTRSLADAEDAVQDGFVRFWRHRKFAKDPAALLFASVRSAALDLQRGERRRRKREERVGAERPLLTNAIPHDAERKRAIERAIATLAEPQREVLVLKIWGGLTFGQIAESLGESANTIASRYRYAVEKLATILEPEVKHDA